MSQQKNSGKVNVSEKSGFPVISIVGYFDDVLVKDVIRYVEDFLKCGKISMIVDFSECVAINSLAVGEFYFLVMKVAEDFQGNCVFTNVPSVMIRIFELATISQYAKIASNMDEAISLLKIPS